MVIYVKHDLEYILNQILLSEQHATREDPLTGAAIAGTPLAELITKASIEDFPGEDRLPAGQRAMLWIARHVPSSSAEILQQIQEHLKRA